MAICDGCGNNMLIPNKVLGHTLCLKCAKTLKANTWKNKDFETNEAVISMKSDVIFSASRAGISGNVIQTVSDYFDAQIEEGLVYKFDGGEDPPLRKTQTNGEKNVSAEKQDYHGPAPQPPAQHGKEIADGFHLW